MSDPATLDSIDDALFAALGALGPTPGAGLFEAVERTSEELTPEAVDDIAPGFATVALLYPERSDPLPDLTVETLAGGVEQTASRSFWCAYVIVRDPRGDAEALKTAPAQQGMLALVRAATNALAGLEVEGLEGSARVTYRGRQSLRGRRGEIYAWRVRVSADHIDEQCDVAVRGAPLTEIDLDLDLEGTADTPPNPLVQGKTTF